MTAPPRRHAAHIAALYALFAGVSTAANIGAQALVVRAAHFDHTIALSVLVGTGVGLVIKYLLDKRYIFRYRTRNAKHDGRTFLLYTLMGVATTGIFWGVEFGFQAVFGTHAMRYLGGVIGLAIGYTAKYQLDKRFVFRD